MLKSVSSVVLTIATHEQTRENKSGILQLARFHFRT